MKIIKILLLISILSPCLALAREEYSFDMSEIEKAVEKKPYNIGGYLEFQPNLFRLNRNSAFYNLRFYNRKRKSTLDEYNLRLLLEADYKQEIVDFFLRANLDAMESDLGSDLGSDFETNILEGYMSLKPSPFLSFYFGKKVLSWGKGYAWNPVGFVQRPKNPDDPNLPLEGFIVIAADYIKSFDGPIQTLSLTPVLIPVSEDINDDFGEIEHINLALKLYLLFYDTDIDIMFFTGASKPFSVGMDFSRNITANFEVHGEFAYINNFKKKFINSSGNLFNETIDTKSFLAGFRYLTEFDTTFICEYYRNDTGSAADEIKDFFAFADNGYHAFLASGDDSLLRKGSFFSDKIYGKRNPMKDYLYLRLSQKEPFDILYFTPAITGIYNINDSSYSISPEFVYTGITNLELRLKGGILSGDAQTEYGEKQNDYRIELRIRYYFDAVNLYDRIKGKTGEQGN